MENKKKKTKKKYDKPSFKSEKLITFGAKCNGTTNGGRKSAPVPPDSCSPDRLMS